MKKPLVIGISLAVLLVSGWVDREAEAREAKTEAEVKARAAGARREMENLPEVAPNRDYTPRNEPVKDAGSEKNQKPALKTSGAKP